MNVIGRTDGREGPTGRLGRYRARDGSAGAPVGIDLDRPHAALVVGKRGYGKSHTLGVLAEAAGAAHGVAPVVVDPMGGLRGLAADAGRHVASPQVTADALPPSAWPDLLGLSATGGAGGVVWRAATAAATLEGMREAVADVDADGATRRAASNHLRLAASWGIFDSAGVDPATLADGDPTVLDCSGLAPAPTNAVVRAVVRGLYEARVAGDLDRLPWVFVDEAHVAFDGVAAPALRTVLRRGRAPGVSLVAATQRPGALPETAVSQADLLVAHRLTAETDLAALSAASPTYLDGTVRSHLPSEVGAALVVDDAAESVHRVRVRDRRTPHFGESARVSREQGRRADSETAE